MRQIVKIGSELILHLLFANSWRIMFTRFCLLYHYRVPNHESISSYDTNSKCIFHSLFTLLGTNQIIHVAYYLKKKKQFSIFKWSYCNNFQQQLVISTFSRNNFHASFTCFASWCKTHHQVQPACEPAVRMLTASEVRPKCTQMTLPSAAGALTSYTQYDRKHKWWMQWSVCISAEPVTGSIRTCIAAKQSWCLIVTPVHQRQQQHSGPGGTMWRRPVSRGSAMQKQCSARKPWVLLSTWMLLWHILYKR